MHKKIEKHFSVFFIMAIAIGIFFPSFGMIFEPYILYFLLTILFLSCLKIDTHEVITHLKKPLLITYITVMLLIIIPITLFFMTRHIYPELALPVLILTAMPAGMSTAALTDISKGNISLSLVITTTTTLLCPFTIPFLLKYLTVSELTIPIYTMLIMLSKIIFLPFIAAIITKKIAKKQIENTRHYYSSISILLIMPLIIGPLAKHSGYYQNNLGQILNITLYLFVISAILHIIGWFMLFRSKKKDRISTSITCAYMNSSLAIVFTAQFFTPLVLLPVILYQFPWDLMLIPFKHIISRLK
ncbi:MAG: bile acid:sodium symporter [archaeon]